MDPIEDYASALFYTDHPGTSWIFAGAAVRESYRKAATAARAALATATTSDITTPRFSGIEHLVFALTDGMLNVISVHQHPDAAERARTGALRTDLQVVELPRDHILRLQGR